MSVKDELDYGSMLDRRELRAEIERLRAIAFDAEEYARNVRRGIIEECARMVESWSVPWQMVPLIVEIAAAIRSLKDRA